RAQIPHVAVLAPGEPELREVVMDVRDGARLGLLEAARDALLDDPVELLVGIERLLAERLGPLDRRERRVRPEALQVRMPVRRARNLELLFRGRLRADLRAGEKTGEHDGASCDR